MIALHKLQQHHSALTITVVVTVPSLPHTDGNYIFLRGFCISFPRENLNFSSGSHYLLEIKIREWIYARSNRHPCVNVEVVTSRSSLHSRPAKLHIFPYSVCLIFAQKKKLPYPAAVVYTETKFATGFCHATLSFHHYLHALATARAASYTCLSFFLHAERIEIFHRTPLGNNSSKEILLPSRRCLETDIFPSRKRRRR